MSTAAATLEVDESQNLVVVRYRGRVGPNDTERYRDDARAALPKIQSAFRLLADLTELESMDVACAPHIESIMDMFNAKGITTVVRVIPDPARDIGLQIMSLFHYGQNVRIITCATLDEATRILASDG
jgi:anti-anti-sigma regulatory factor